MQNTLVRAVYQRGAFRPLEDVGAQFAEGQEVELLVQEPMSESKSLDLSLSDEAQRTLATFKNFYAGLTDEEIAQIEQNLRHRVTFNRKLDMTEADQE
jgi:predicted DNA-binding antitoxin AbrB/MazE fold protein